MLKQESKILLRPLIFWEGFPACGLLLKKVADELGEDLVVVATKPAVPFLGLEEELGHKIIWLNEPNEIWSRRDEFSDRNFVLHTGWGHGDWLKFDRFLKKKNNVKIVLVSDNRFRNDFRQWLGAIYFRFFLRRYFDGAFTPGISGKKLLAFLGMPKDHIYSPNYGAYEGIFKSTRQINERRNEFLFVGQLIKRKSIDLVIQAFKEYKLEGGRWSLRISGDGPLAALCEGGAIFLEGFLQPNEVAERMNNAKAFIFPSRDDNWGTALCEAAACGMLLVSAKSTGASFDILTDEENGYLLEKITKEDIKRAMFRIERMSNEELASGSAESIRVAGRFDSGAYYEAFKKMQNDLCD